MKKYFSFFLCIVSIVAFCLLPSTVFGATTQYNSNINWGAIISDNNLDVAQRYCICSDTSGYYYIFSQTGVSFGLVQQLDCNSSTVSDVTSLTGRNGATGTVWKAYKSEVPYNPYGAYSLVNNSGGFTVSNVDSVFANDIDIVYHGDSSVVVFQQTPLTAMGTSQTSLQQMVTSSVLQGLLSELVGMLPILVPILVGFIAIRKGLRFTFRMLRSS